MEPFTSFTSANDSPERTERIAPDASDAPVEAIVICSVGRAMTRKEQEASRLLGGGLS